MPENRGFDRWLGYLQVRSICLHAIGDTERSHSESRSQGGEDYYARSTTLRAGNCTATRDFWFGTPGDGRPVADRDYWTGEYSTSVYGEFLVRQIDGHNASQPLFAYAAFQAVHYPLQVRVS